MTWENIVLGFPKCGTASLQDYLRIKSGKSRKDTSTTKREWCWFPFEEQLAMFDFEFGDPEDYKLYFITRDPVERIWSAWEAWHYWYSKYTFEEYLELDSDEYAQRFGESHAGKGVGIHGEVNPVKQVDYKHWLTPWLDNFPEQVIVYQLEKIRKDPLFPHNNSLKKSEVPDKYREMILRAL